MGTSQLSVAWQQLAHQHRLAERIAADEVVYVTATDIK